VSHFEINPGALEGLAQDIADKTTAAVDTVAREDAGQPVEVIVPKLRSALIGAGVEPNEQWVRETAEAISKAPPATP
jgi:hypothetical protein